MSVPTDVRRDAAHPAGGPVSRANPDAPVRVDVAMPRVLYDRLTGHDEAPRSRYDAETGTAEFVAEPGISHEWRASRLSALLGHVAAALDEAGHPAELLVAGATRLLSDDGAFEPDTSLFMGGARVRAAMRLEGWLDRRKGHPAPDLVVEIDRSVDSRAKLAPYFRLGVREAWTWSRADGVRIWIADPDATGGFVVSDRSRVLPGIAHADLEGLLAGSLPSEAIRGSRAIAQRVAHAIIAGAS